MACAPVVLVNASGIAYAEVDGRPGRAMAAGARPERGRAGGGEGRATLWEARSNPLKVRHCGRGMPAGRETRACAAPYANVHAGCAREEPFSIHGHLLNISVFLHITMHPIQHFPASQKSACDRAIYSPCTPSLGPIRWRRRHRIERPSPSLRRPH